jgi:hypothetical protein
VEPEDQKTEEPLPKVHEPASSQHARHDSRDDQLSFAILYIVCVCASEVSFTQIVRSVLRSPDLEARVAQ